MTTAAFKEGISSLALYCPRCARHPLPPPQLRITWMPVVSDRDTVMLSCRRCHTHATGYFSALDMLVAIDPKGLVISTLEAMLKEMEGDAPKNPLAYAVSKVLQYHGLSGTKTT